MTKKTNASCRLKPEDTIENDIESYFQKICKENDILCYKFVSPRNSGVPDRLLIANGKVVFVELKRPGEKPRRLQRAVIKIMREHGATVLVADNYDKVNEIVDFMKQKRKTICKIESNA